jgi:hypothetical protein
MKMEKLGNIKKLTKNKLITVFSLFVISIGIIGGCGGGSTAPFGSTLTFIQATEDIQICGEGLEPRLFQVVLTDAAGSPLNDVLLSFDLVFGTENSKLIDTDGDGIPDARIFQMVDNDACSPNKCMNTPIEEWFLSGAFVDSPYETITNKSGVAEVVIIFPGFLNIFNDTGQLIGADPTTLTAFSGANAEFVEISVNSDCEILEL